MDFQQSFLTSDPYSNHIESNWQSFKTALHETMARNIPQRLYPRNVANCLPCWDNLHTES